jgi:lysophospholipase L1-like esterase
MPMPPLRSSFIATSLTICLLALVFSSSTLLAQPPATKKPSAKPAPNWGEIFKLHWIERVKSFRDENKKGYPEKNIILLGDSITEGFKVEKHFPDRHVLNRGIGADTIGNALPESDKRGILRRMDESVFDCNPTDVFLLIGINDLGSGHKPQTIEAGYREILQQIKKKAPNVHVHLLSLLPTRGNYAKHNVNVNDVNKRLQKLAKEFDYDYIDLHSKMTDDKGELKKEFTNDGLHLKEPGYKIWKAEIEKSMGW